MLASTAIAVIGVVTLLYTQPQPSERLVLATTTSTYDSGLLDYLLPYFEGRCGVKVHVLPVGTGQALEIASRGDADVILVHAPSSEREYVDKGVLVNRVPIMYNDFIIVGPLDDPAGIKDMKIAAEAFKMIRGAGVEGRAVFISRGDNSGTHMREMDIWHSEGINPIGESWHLDVGQGMGETLLVTDEKGGYTLSDRGTWLSMRGTLSQLRVLVEGDPDLINPYSGLLINPRRYPWVNLDAAKKFIGFLISEEGQGLIANFKMGGERLFQPCYGNAPPAWGSKEEEREAMEYWNHAKPSLLCASPSVFHSQLALSDGVSNTCEKSLMGL